MLDTCSGFVGTLLPGARAAALLLIVLAPLTGTACLDRLTGRTAPVHVNAAGTAVPSVSLVAGAPIGVTASTPRTPADGSGRILTPIAAYGSLVLLRTGGTGSPSTPASYLVWDPASGSQTPVPSWPAEAQAKERLVGVSGDWLVLTSDAAPQSTTIDLILRNLKTGERRTIGSSGGANSPPRVAVAEGWIAWVDSAAIQPALHVYDLSSGTDRTLPTRVRGINNLAVGNGVVAWWQGFGAQQPRLVVHDFSTGKFDAIQASSLTALALSGDGHTLAWIQGSSSSNPGLFLRDLTTGSGGRLLGGQAVGVSLSVSGRYISWQPGFGAGPSTAGVYNVQTHELRLVQPAAGTTARLARVIGPWFVWSETASQSAAAATGPVSGCCYLLRLPG